MTYEELMALLAVLHKKVQVTETKVKAEKDAEKKAEFIAELNALCDEVDDTQKMADAQKARIEAEEKALARSGAYAEPVGPKTVATGALNASTIVVGQDNIFKDPKLGFDNMGECAMAVYRAQTGRAHDPRLAVLQDEVGINAAGLRQGNGPEGGFLVPPAFMTTIWAENQATSLDLFAMTSNFNLGKSESLSIPAIDETSRKNGSRWGGVSAKWAEEEATLTESEPKFREVTIRPKELHVFTKVSEKLLNNSPIALEQFISMAANDEIIFRQSDGVMNGDGVGKPKGILKSPALVSVAKESGQSADTVVTENVLNMYAKMPPRWKNGSLWLINSDVTPQFQGMTIGDQPVWIPPGGLMNTPGGTLLGRPIIETEYNPVLGDKGDIILVNLRAYLSGQRGGVRADSSIHFNFDTVRKAFRWITEADGQTWMITAVTDFQGNATKSPYVTLDERT